MRTQAPNWHKRHGHYPMSGIGAALFGILFYTLSFSYSIGQTALPKLWMQFYAQTNAPRHCYLEADMGYRGDQVGAIPSTLLARVGIGRYWKSGYLAVGFAWFEALHSQPSLDQAEMRIYQKLMFQHALSILKVHHIFRTEEIWQQNPDHSQYDFRLRLRYLLQLSYPFKSWTILGAQPIVTANSEILLLAQQNAFHQYRVYGAAGLKWKKHWKYEMGLMELWTPSNLGGLMRNPILRSNLSFTW